MRGRAAADRIPAVSSSLKSPIDWSRGLIDWSEKSYEVALLSNYNMMARRLKRMLLLRRRPAAPRRRSRARPAVPRL